jgi:tRNA pseudouridine38-40 synthase
MEKRFYYLVHIQYLGFRFHGWAKQPKLKTLHQMVDKTMFFMFGEGITKTIGCSRTDSKVSAAHYVFELFINKPITDFDQFIREFDSNSPSDIRGLKIEETNAEFNIINSAKVKEYVYLFAFGEKAHPFAAPMVTTLPEQLDLELMKQGAELFEGEHNFAKYCTKPSEKTNFVRTINYCKIEVNTKYQANFFPDKTYNLRIKSKGFLRYQVRLIMGQLFKLGKGEITLKDIETSLTGEDRSHFNEIAPQSSLILESVTFE